MNVLQSLMNLLQRVANLIQSVMNSLLDPGNTTHQVKISPRSNGIYRQHASGVQPRMISHQLHAKGHPTESKMIQSPPELKVVDSGTGAWQA